MPTIGRYKYPTRELDDILLEVEKVETALKQGITKNGLANALGQKLSGAFFHKVADMKMFGLIEGRGTVNLTNLADSILHPLSKDERREARERAWLNVDAINLVHAIFKGKVPEREEEYLAILGERTGEKDRAKLPIKAKQVLDLYKEALSDILVEKIPGEIEGPSPIAAKGLPSTFTTAPPAGIIEIKVGDFYQRLPFTPKGVDIGIDFLNLLKNRIKEERVKETKESIAKT